MAAQNVGLHARGVDLVASCSLSTTSIACAQRLRPRRPAGPPTSTARSGPPRRLSCRRPVRAASWPVRHGPCPSSPGKFLLENLAGPFASAACWSGFSGTAGCFGFAGLAAARIGHRHGLGAGRVPCLWAVSSGVCRRRTGSFTAYGLAFRASTRCRSSPPWGALHEEVRRRQAYPRFTPVFTGGVNFGSAAGFDSGLGRGSTPATWFAVALVPSAEESGCLRKTRVTAPAATTRPATEA